MPPIKIDHIVSFSSEDPAHTANNIISTDSSKKWKCQSPGERQAIVVLQLEKASQITAVDIGNEHSAYIEVLVSRSSSSDDFKVLLVNSSFMTPLEARQSQNVNKVRMFTKDQLSKPECEEKWDRVKIICTQPFNKRVQYGLSFITLHSNVSKTSESNSQESVGRFLIRPESPDNLSAGTLFAKRKEEKPTAAAAIRDATSSTSLALYGSPTCKPKLKNQDPGSTPKKKPSQENENITPKDRNRNELFYTKDDEEDNDKIDKIMKKKEEEENQYKEKEQKVEQKTRKNFWGADADSAKEDNKKKKKNEEEKIKKKRDKSPGSPQKRVVNKKDQVQLNTPNSSKKKGGDIDSPSLKTKDTKRKNKDVGENVKPKKLKIMKRFNELLNGVTIVISGIQNPDRANLRTMALSMGAKYKPDWDNSCTHLICAFPNTPKFNQVKGKGKIIKKSWIEMCHKERKRLPWRRFALDKSDLDENESEDEIHELVDLPLTSTKKPTKYDSDDEHLAAGSDTEERIAKILAERKEEVKAEKDKEMQKKKTSKKEASTDDSTDEESLNVAGNSKNANRKKDSPKFSKHFKIPKKEESSDSTDNETLNNFNNNNKTKSPITKKKNRTDVSDDNSDVSLLAYPSEDALNGDSFNISTSFKRTNARKEDSPNDCKMDVYEADTDEEMPTKISRENRLLDVFHGEKFYVDQSFEEDTYRTLCKYIVAYNGKCVDDVTSDIDKIITTKENSETLKEINQKAQCIDQKWILQIHRNQQFIPIKNYAF